MMSVPDIGCCSSNWMTSGRRNPRNPNCTLATCSAWFRRGLVQSLFCQGLCPFFLGFSVLSLPNFLYFLSNRRHRLYDIRAYKHSCHQHIPRSNRHRIVSERLSSKIKFQALYERKDRVTVKLSKGTLHMFSSSFDLLARKRSYENIKIHD